MQKNIYIHNKLTTLIFQPICKNKIALGMNLEILKSRDNKARRYETKIQ